VLARVGPLPPAEDSPRRETFTGALRELGRRAEHRGIRVALEAGAEPAKELNSFLEGLNVPSLALSIDPASGVQANVHPLRSVRELAAWVAHAYAGDATGFASTSRPNPRGFGYPAGALDWEEYLGALEEIGYQGFLTIWPDPHRPAAAQFTTIRDRLARLS